MIVMKKCFPLLLILLALSPAAHSQDKPVKIAIAGMTHGHVGWILKRQDIGDIEVVGFSEPNNELAMRLLKNSRLSTDLWYENLDDMLRETKPEAVCAFGSIYEHLEVVEKCAPLGIHVMVEKPMAVSMDHAARMYELADKHQIHLLTNYETSWYASNQKIFELFNKGEIGDIRKIVVHDGHQGPVEIGCSKEFLGWLTDPVLNGGGAIIDFGCYGANLTTWLMGNKKPFSVTAVTQQLKPGIYPNVDDEATIVLEYPGSQAIIQASWNWPFSRKDIEVYGQQGALFGPDGTTIVKRIGKKENTEKLQPRPYPFADPFAYLSGVLRGSVDPGDGLYSLTNNMIVVEILSKAIQSAKERKTIYFEE
jgi:predicted dehydrogenase